MTILKCEIARNMKQYIKYLKYSIVHNIQFVKQFSIHIFLN